MRRAEILIAINAIFLRRVISSVFILLPSSFFVRKTNIEDRILLFKSIWEKSNNNNNQKVYQIETVPSENFDEMRGRCARRSFFFFHTKSPGRSIGNTAGDVVVVTDAKYSTHALAIDDKTTTTTTTTCYRVEYDFFPNAFGK